MGRSRLKMGTWLLLLLAALVVTARAQEISCKDDSGRDVDWFVGHKFPKLNPAPGANAPSTLPLGTTYRFMNPSSNKWILSQSSIDQGGSMIGHTLLQASRSGIVTMGHNDQPPIGTAGHAYGHSKGVILVNSVTGNAVWLSHSVPVFPDIRKLIQNNYEYAAERKKNGQSFLCVTLNKNQLDILGQHLYRVTAFSYDTQPVILAPSLQTHAPWLFRVSQNAYSNFENDKPNAPASITSRGGASLRLFSKTKLTSDHKDVWSQIVSPGLTANMYVQSWLCGRGENLGRETSGAYSTDNVAKIYIPWNIVKTNPAATQNWYTGPTKDHSKFAISSRNRGDFVCIGDMNRKVPQRERGGGAACISNRILWEQYFEMLTNNVAPNPVPPTAADLICLP